MKLIEMRCPSCGGKLRVDSLASKCTCPYCAEEINLENVQQVNKQNTKEEKTKVPNTSEEKIEYLKGQVDSNGGKLKKSGSLVKIARCPYCGNSIEYQYPQTSCICGNCNKRIIKLKETKDSKRRNTRLNLCRWIIILAPFALISSCVQFCASNNESSKTFQATSTQTIETAIEENKEPEESETVVIEESAEATSTPEVVVVEQTETEEKEPVHVTVPESSEEGEHLVWVPTNGGTKYHNSKYCSSMQDPVQVTEETAKANGYTPCGRCIG